ncbi:hypothetical protein ACWCQK_40520 [Streptomyces sp. NPDC002306]
MCGRRDGCRGIRLFDNPGGSPVRLELLDGEDHFAPADMLYRPVAATTG